MLVLVVYDINTTYKYGEKRLAKVAKKCQSYGRRVQNSTYECLIDQSQFLILKSSILDIIEEKVDSVRFYILGNNYKNKVQVYGLDNGINAADDLIF